MEKKTPNQERKAKLEDEFEGIVSNNKFDPKQHFPTKEDIPGLSENQQTYDYAADMADCRAKATQMVSSLIRLHLGEDPKVLTDPIVMEKMDEDIDAYAYLKFMAKQSQRLYITNLTNIDNGQTGASMTEAISTLQKEQRDTLKMLSQKFKEIDFSYRMLKDVLLSAVIPDVVEEETTILDFKKMNNSIDGFMKDRAELRLSEQKEAERKALLEKKNDIVEKTDQDDVEKPTNETGTQEKTDF